jgi:hypothetical protein
MCVHLSSKTIHQPYHVCSLIADQLKHKRLNIETGCRLFCVREELLAVRHPRQANLLLAVFGRILR